ncbi:25174_t:CDS:1, partial [Racocetra persica]
KLISSINQQFRKCVISDNNINVENIKMDIDTTENIKTDIDTTENIKIDLDSKKRKLDIDFENIKIDIDSKKNKMDFIV